ncbi:MAG: SgrR family transcriptional regulator [Candidatus Bipolaricaulota bacterium]|nr:SgrR family transcriptional regulator [Candidatus Bipolaricaulota bacterium]
MFKTTITPRGGRVKSAVPRRPDVLPLLPRSCQVLWDLLASRPLEATTLRALAYAARLSLAQVHRALRRLEQAGLLRWERSPGRGHRSRIVLLWPSEVIPSPKGAIRPPASPQRQNPNVSSPPPSPPPTSKANSPTGGAPQPAPLSSRALAWALAQVRNALLARPAVEPARRAAILAALGPAVHRALRKGKVRTPGELADLVAWILRRLEERRGLGLDLGATRRWAEWCVREGLRRLAEERAEREASERFLAEFLREAEEARRAWQDPAAAEAAYRLWRRHLRPQGGPALRPSRDKKPHPSPRLLGETSLQGGLSSGRRALPVPGAAEDDAYWQGVLARLAKVTGHPLRPSQPRRSAREAPEPPLHPAQKPTGGSPFGARRGRASPLGPKRGQGPRPGLAGPRLP